MSNNNIPDSPPTWFVAIIFVLSVLISLGFTGVVIWGIIKLVNWVTAQ